MKQLLKLLKETLIALWQKIVNIPYLEIARNVLNFIGDVMHRALFNVILPKRLRGLTKKEIYTIIFKSDTPTGKKFDIWLLIAIGANVLVLMLESMAGTAKWFATAMRIIGWIFTILFTFEFYLRVYCLKRPSKYLLSFYGVIDVLSIFPAYLSLFIPAASTLSVLRMMRLLRVFRIFKMQRFLDESRFLLNSLKRSATKILIFMMFVFITAVILGATMYGIEGEKNPEISSIPRGIYWAVVTITTVGYGDIAPVTSMGQFISMIVMLLGYSIIAVPMGVVAGETLEEHRRMKDGRNTKQTEKNQQAPETDEGDPATEAPAEGAPTEDPAPLPLHSEPWCHDDDPGARAKPEDLF